MSDIRTLVFTTCMRVNYRGGRMSDLLHLGWQAPTSIVPCRTPALKLVWIFTNAKAGTYEFRVRITDSSDTEIRLPSPLSWSIESPGPLHRAENFADLSNLTFPDYGLYRIAVEQDGVEVAALTFEVLRDEDWNAGNSGLDGPIP